MSDACPDDEEFQACEEECRELLKRGWGPDYTECVEVCYHLYEYCDYDEWMGLSDE